MAQHASRMFVKRPGKHAVRALASALAVAAVMPTALAAPAEAADRSTAVVSRGVEIPEFYNPPSASGSVAGGL